MSGIVSELRAEIERLRAELDELKAQEPVAFTDSDGAPILKKKLPAWTDLFAHPVPRVPEDAILALEHLLAEFVEDEKKLGCQEDAYYSGKVAGAEECVEALRKFAAAKEES